MRDAAVLSANRVLREFIFISDLKFMDVLALPYGIYRPSYKIDR
jgi:hypothetical protein